MLGSLTTCPLLTNELETLYPLETNGHVLWDRRILVHLI